MLRLKAKLLSPWYSAVIVWLPTASAEVMIVATPLVTEADPRSAPVVVSKKSTLPVGVPSVGLAARTPAVKVTDCPKTGDVAELTSEVKLRFRPPDLQKMYIRTLNLVTAEYRVAWGNR